jgi:hypothetical protein
VETLTAASTQKIIDTLREASQIQRCDFSFAGGGSYMIVCRGHQPGMREAARLLVADAARLIHSRAGDGEDAHDPHDAAADRLATCFRMCGHLAQDKTIISPLIAHLVFGQADALAALSIDGRAWDDGQVTALWNALKGFNRADPFGYGPALVETRKETIEVVGYAMSNMHEEFGDDVRSMLGRCDTDRLIWFAVIANQVCRLPHETDEKLLEQAAPLDDVISLEALAQTLVQGEAVRKLLARGALEQIAQLQHPIIGQAGTRVREGASDFRDALARFEPRVQGESSSKNPAPEAASAPSSP